MHNTEKEGHKIFTLKPNSGKKQEGRRRIHYNLLVRGFTEIVCQSLSAGLFSKKEKKIKPPFSLEENVYLYLI